MIKGVSHVSLSVTDLARSLNFYRDILEMDVLREPFDSVAFDGREAILLAGRVAINLQEHAASDGSSFDPARTGLDHLAFHVGDRQTLRDWIAKLEAAGVPHSGIRAVEGWGWMIELRDPDSIQLELFAIR